MDDREIRKQISKNSKVGELAYLLDTEDFETFIKSIKESPKNATLREDTPLWGEGELLIRKAVQWGCLECVKVLVENGANVNEDMGMRESIFLYALKMHDYEIALCLLDHGAEPKNGDYGWHLRTFFNSDTLSREAEYDIIIDKLRAGAL